MGGLGVGKAGEDAVRAAHNIGDKQRIVVNGRNRVPDGINSNAISEVKNAGRIYYTKQLRDYSDYAAANGLEFNLYARDRNTRLSKNIEQAIRDGRITNIRYVYGN